MEAGKIAEQLKYVSKAGVTLSTEERMQLEYALSTLQTSMGFETLYFWGKIEGKNASQFSLSTYRSTPVPCNRSLIKCFFSRCRN